MMDNYDNNLSEDSDKQTELIKTKTLYHDSSSDENDKESSYETQQVCMITANMDIPELNKYDNVLKMTANMDIPELNKYDNVLKMTSNINLPETNNYNINPLTRIESFTQEQEPINGWDNDAMKTITNWYDIFKQQSFMYQWILEKNLKISNKLIMASIIASSALGIFTSFKIWINKDSFNTASDLFIMLSNFSIALMTGYSKSYVDNRRNENIKHHIQEIDELFGEICAQLLKSPVYRMNANDFFKEHNNKFTKLMSSTPSMTIYELKQSKKEYEEFKKNFYNNI